MAAYLLDSNLIIYAAKPGGEAIREFIARQSPFVSVISKIETLGYHALSKSEREQLDHFFDAAMLLPVTGEVVEKAVELRQNRSMSLGDSLIAGTALSLELDLATHNVSDFDWISGLRVVDPFK